MEKIKIFVVDDHEIFRNGLKMVLERLEYPEVIGEATNGEEFMEMMKTLDPDIVLMDIEMPVMNGIDATEKILSERPETKIIALTMFNENEYIQTMIDAGVKGFLIKSVSKEMLDKAIKTVSKGGNYYSEELFDFFTRQISREEERSVPVIELTRREKQILQLISEGLSNKEIAEMLFISERTVVGHKSNLLSKSGCKNTLSLMSYAIKNKLVVI